MDIQKHLSPRRLGVIAFAVAVRWISIIVLPGSFLPRKSPPLASWKPMFRVYEAIRITALAILRGQYTLNLVKNIQERNEVDNQLQRCCALHPFSVVGNRQRGETE